MLLRHASIALFLATFGACAVARAQPSAHTPTQAAEAPAATAPSSAATAPSPEATPATEAPHEPTPEELAEARRIFAEGVSHADHGRWEQAVASFRRVLAIRPAPAVRFNLASALVELGRYSEAEPLLDAVIADPQGGAFIARSRSLEAEMAHRGGHVVVRFAEPAEGLVVSLDDVALTPEQIGTPIFVGAGTHEARLRDADGITLSSARVTVAAGETKEAVLALLDRRNVPTSIATTEAPVSPAPRRERPAWVRNKWTWIGVGIGVAAIVTTVVLATTIDGKENAPASGNANPGVVRF